MPILRLSPGSICWRTWQCIELIEALYTIKVCNSCLTPRYWDGTEGTQKLSYPQIFSAKLNFLLQDVISEISAMKIFILKYSKDLRVCSKHIFDMGRRERTCVAAPPAFPRWWSKATWAPAPGSVADGTFPSWRQKWLPWHSKVDFCPIQMSK